MTPSERERGRRRIGRHRMVCVRCTDSELEALKCIAYASGFDSPAAWVRAQVERARGLKLSDVERGL